MKALAASAASVGAARAKCRLVVVGADSKSAKLLLTQHTQQHDSCSLRLCAESDQIKASSGKGKFAPVKSSTARKNRRVITPLAATDTRRAQTEAGKKRALCFASSLSIIWRSFRRRRRRRGSSRSFRSQPGGQQERELMMIILEESFFLPLPFADWPPADRLRLEAAAKLTGGRLRADRRLLGVGRRKFARMRQF